MAWDPSSDIPVRGSHAPRVGAGESRAEAATRRVESASATAAADGEGPDLLDRVVETLEELAEFLAGGAARDRGAVAPPGLQALLGMEESTPMGSARDWEGPAGSDTADEPRQSPLGCTKNPRRAVEARPNGLAGDGFEVHGPASEAAVAGVADIFEEPRPGSDRVGFLHGAHRDLSSPVRARDADPQQAPTGASQCHGASDCGMDGAPTARGVRAGGGAPVSHSGQRPSLWRAIFASGQDALDIRETVIAPRSPWQNAYAERVIGSIRRECLDHVVVIGERHLREILSKYVDYYNGTRTHLSLSKDAPEPRSVQLPSEGRVVKVPRVGGLHHEYLRRAA